MSTNALEWGLANLHAPSGYSSGGACLRMSASVAVRATALEGTVGRTATLRTRHLPKLVSVPYLRRSPRGSRAVMAAMNRPRQRRWAATLQKRVDPMHHLVISHQIQTRLRDEAQPRRLDDPTPDLSAIRMVAADAEDSPNPPSASCSITCISSASDPPPHHPCLSPSVTTSTSSRPS